MMPLSPPLWAVHAWSKPPPPSESCGAGIKLTYDQEGNTDYHKQVLNSTNPDDKYIPDFSKGNTWSDSHLAFQAHQAVDLTEQDGNLREFLQSVNHTLPTPKWEWSGFVDRHADWKEAQLSNETLQEFPIWDYDEYNHSWSKIGSYKYPESEPPFQNNTRKMGEMELRAPFIMPLSQPPFDKRDGWEPMLEELELEHKSVPPPPPENGVSTDPEPWDV